MQIKSLAHALPYFFMQRIHGNDPGNLPELERSNGVLENILRWEDDGGKIDLHIAIKPPPQLKKAF